ncbi:Uma2 family endonuclease [Aurantimonas sp. MSK8Z-1]|uniref:Uma2 family endonuclease n=1 Tax=Mangrovibrevibacter kandeliae TaxID=2968473 RepID=UPI00211782B2|nr:Uma2 family endonuclease [Aurantimonas sp. MSK8Z-1]MCW4114671.1 Uma2 family endonuclease [Aurantimonas sp. MSK8Z-1]
MSALPDTRSETDLPIGLTIEAFFDWAAQRQERYELVDGRPLMLPWVKRSHSRLSANIAFLFEKSADRSRSFVHQGDFAIPTGPRSIRYADVLVEPAGGDMQARTAEDAVVIVEVLSDSTAPQDFGPKRLEYLRLASLRCYLIVDPDKSCIWQWQRGGEDAWPEDPTIVRSGAVEVAALGWRLPLAAIYDGVLDLPPAPEGGPS